MARGAEAAALAHELTELLTGEVGVTFSQQPQLGDFAADARLAITQAPDYFVKWYTLKSIGLGVAVGLIGFLIGRATVKR